MAAKTQSRYQVGLSYEPGMSSSAYKPERGPGGSTDIGDYTVTPIPLGGDTGGGVTAPQTEGGSGLGGTGLGVSLLGALANPNVLSALRNGYNSLTKPSVTPVDTTMQEMAHPMPDGTFQAPVFDGTMQELAHDYSSLFGGAGDTADKAAGLLGDMGLGSWQEGVLGAGNGSGGLFGYGGMSAFPSGTGAVPWEGALGSVDLGLGAVDLASSLGGFAGGALGTWVAGQAGYNGNRDPTGSSIGSSIGATIGGILGGPLAPITAFLGAQFGGMIGGQFGPEQTIGAHTDNLATYRPGQGWSYASASDNGGQPMDGFAQNYLAALDQYAAAHGYMVNPDANGTGFKVGYVQGGDGTRATGSGYYIQTPGMYALGGPGETPYGQVWFGNNLADPYQNAVRFGGGQMTAGHTIDAPLGADPALGAQYLGNDWLNVPTGGTNFDAMVQYGFNNLAGNYYIPQGGSAFSTAYREGGPGTPLAEPSQG